MLVECDRHAGAFYVHLMQPKKLSAVRVQSARPSLKRQKTRGLVIRMVWVPRLLRKLKPTSANWQR